MERLNTMQLDAPPLLSGDEGDNDDDDDKSMDHPLQSLPTGAVDQSSETALESGCVFEINEDGEVAPDLLSEFGSDDDMEDVYDSNIDFDKFLQNLAADCDDLESNEEDNPLLQPIYTSAAAVLDSFNHVNSKYAFSPADVLPALSQCEYVSHMKLIEDYTPKRLKSTLSRIEMVLVFIMQRDPDVLNYKSLADVTTAVIQKKHKMFHQASKFLLQNKHRQPSTVCCYLRDVHHYCKWYAYQSPDNVATNFGGLAESHHMLVVDHIIACICKPFRKKVSGTALSLLLLICLHKNNAYFADEENSSDENDGAGGRRSAATRRRQRATMDDASNRSPGVCGRHFGKPGFVTG